MITKTLDEIFCEIARKMCDSVDINAYEEDSSFSFIYEGYGYYIDGDGRIGGDWHEDGDGYWSPREYYLKNGWGELNNLSIYHYDEETDEETEIPDEVVQNIFCRLNEEISRYMNN